MNNLFFKIFLCAFIACALNSGFAYSDNRQIKPLATDYVILYRSPDPNKVYMYDPSIAVCPNGRLIGAFSLGGPGAKKVKPEKGDGQGRLYTSDDEGETWQYRTNFPMWHFTPFVAGNKLYLLGHMGDLRIMSSDNWGSTWSDYCELTKGQSWHGSATNLWYKDNFVYLVKERKIPGQMKGGWKISECAPVLLRGDIKKDLTKRNNWTFSSEMTFRQAINDKELNWFGVPFYDGFYPEIKKDIGGRFNFPPIGWLEANIVQIMDPKHYWYDPEGKTFHLFLRAHTGITNLACMLKAVEQDDGTIKTMLQTVPSGKKQVYLPFPGGQMKFSIVYDKHTKLYWMVGTQSTYSMIKPHKMPDNRYGLGDNERRRLVLYFSKNMVDWCFAGLVSAGAAENASRHYPQMVIQDKDLLIMSRSGDKNAKNAHNGNIITFHRIENFRSLVY